MNVEKWGVGEVEESARGAGEGHLRRHGFSVERIEDEKRKRGYSCGKRAMDENWVDGERDKRK